MVIITRIYVLVKQKSNVCLGFVGNLEKNKTTAMLIVIVRKLSQKVLAFIYDNLRTMICNILVVLLLILNGKKLA